ncbi:PP-loop domain protein [Caldicellulosiruptor kronotskyensis 2002]|uniref:PP-loop domain protein n=1 Tax=Caldicellulosiruptor kronotskyensis (strain DSM 18902 / VKM B-2412 / 2002) TaxID=632348 RepID=E4SF28_CALK2|nr:ATP-dependent sacrificial sulfur transferase LarE [Caldicellulosiruptor kronotskyensis]ADQ46353.1 PP-loop domain protein [Caldicellulosiruptor kronotskyensis 2002]
MDIIIDETLQEKYEKLKNYIKSLGSLAIAYSGGVDSTFLVKVAYDVLGDRVIAVTATSSTYPKRELNDAITFIKQIGAKHIVIESEELEIEGFNKNPVDRCYYCKKELFEKIWKVAKAHGIEYVADGSNFDDLNDFRPGMKAACELNVVSPLKVAGLTKEDIRKLSKELGLPTWDKPAFACLSSRIPYGERITKEKLSMIEKAEEYLIGLGFKQVRVRYHQDKLARIEIGKDEMEKFLDIKLIENVRNKFKELGFLYITLDLEGYRTGSMNLSLNL